MGLKVTYRAVCGLDAHKDSVFACIMNEKGEKIQQKFGVLTRELDSLRDLLRLQTD